MPTLHHQIALITGGTAGIGQASARHLAQAGARVIITGRSAERGAAIVADLSAAGGQADFIQADVRSADDCRRVVETAIEIAGHIDILFNNAGIVPFGTILETPLDVWRDAWETNVGGTYLMSRAVLPGMLARGRGVIINNASDWGVVGGQGAAAYCTTKGAVVQLTRALALDYARNGIRVNAVCPGDTYVERWRSRRDDEDALRAYLADLGAALPMGRVGDVDEIARAVVFLASDDSSYMTGQLLIIDGGNTAGGASARY